MGFPLGFAMLLCIVTGLGGAILGLSPQTRARGFIPGPPKTDRKRNSEGALRA